jgi:putative lipoic acid-binding regulatory protein
MSGDGSQQQGSAQDTGGEQEKKPLIDYPTVYTFKVMGRRAPDFVEHVRGLFRAYMGTEISPDSIQEQPSSKGTYVSVSVSVYLLSEEHRRSIYVRLKEEPRVVYYL